MTECRQSPELHKHKWVSKAWGGEMWLVNNELYCAKFLFLRPGYQCSLHRHAGKDETFIVREGKIELEVGDEKIVLQGGDTKRIHPGTWHRFANHTDDLVTILEVSTHHSEEDVERKEESKKISTPSS